MIKKKADTATSEYLEIAPSDIRKDSILVTESYFNEEKLF